MTFAEGSADGKRMYRWVKVFRNVGVTQGVGMRGPVPVISVGDDRLAQRAKILLRYDLR